MIRILALLTALVLPGLAAAQETIVAGLSQDRVSITANFDGSQILIFGAVKRDAPAPADPLSVIVTVSGPNEHMTVRRKSRVFGIWINTDSVHIDAAPSFYAVATSSPWDQTLSETEDLRYRVSIPRAIRSVGATVSDSPNFTDALIRIRGENGLYQTLPQTVDFSEQTLFRTAIDLPANLTEGDYRTRILLTRQGKVVDEFDTTIGVHKIGLERWVFNLAHHQPALYGILSLVIAIAAGWGASAVFRYIRS
jgi:uncharacterized protein (TIGR02186 family)